MKNRTKEILGATALLSLGAVAVTAKNEAALEKHELVPIYGDAGEVVHLEGVPTLEQIEGALTLAKIHSAPVQVRPFMGPPGTPLDPSAIRVTTWEIELADGRTLRLELQGAMKMREGETIEEARERWGRTKE